MTKRYYSGLLATGALIFSLAPSHARAQTCDFEAKIKLLAAGEFVLENNGYKTQGGSVTYHPPEYKDIDESSAEEKDMRARLVSAYAASPNFLKRRLCDLNVILIDNVNRDYPGWGFWENPDPATSPRVAQQSPGVPANKTYLGIASTLLGSNAPPIHELERLTNFKHFLGEDNGDYTYASSGDVEDTLIGVFAHEVAHVLWVKDAASSAPLIPYLVENHNKCAEFDRSWTNVIRHGRRMKLPDQEDNLPDTPHKVRDVKNEANSNEKKRKTRGVLKGPKSWFSLFAAVAPVEDFAETLKLHALLVDADLDTLTAKVGAEDVYIIQNGQPAQAFVKKKVDCVAMIESMLLPTGVAN